MSHDERLKDNTLVLWEWQDGRDRFRVTFVDGFPKLEHRVNGTWYIAKLGREGAVMVNAFVIAFVGGLRFQLERAAAEERAARAHGNHASRVHWAWVARRIEVEITALPAPWNAVWRKRR